MITTTKYLVVRGLGVLDYFLNPKTDYNWTKSANPILKQHHSRIVTQQGCKPHIFYILFVCMGSSKLITCCNQFIRKDTQKVSQLLGFAKDLLQIAFHMSKDTSTFNLMYSFQIVCWSILQWWTGLVYACVSAWEVKNINCW